MLAPYGIHTPSLSVRRKAVQQRKPTLYTMEPRLTSTKPPRHILEKVHTLTCTTLHYTTHLTSYTLLHIILLHPSPHHITLLHFKPHCTTPLTPIPLQIQENKINIEVHTISTLQVKHYCVDSKFIM